MQQFISRRSRGIMALVVLGAIAAGPALAQGRGHESQGRGNNERNSEKAHDNQQRNGNSRKEDRHTQARFNNNQRRNISEHYDREMHQGHCPPGLYKKKKSCVPPGHARRYVIGRPLPRDVIFYDLPQPIVIQLGAPPRGYRYVRVSNDILMLALGTGLVVDALQNLGGNRR